MTLELLSYLNLLLFSVLVTICKLPRKTNAIVFFLVALTYSIASRMSGFDIDMVVYADTLTYENLFTSYYLREPIYWLTSNFIYNNIVDSPVVVFVIFDLTSFILIYLSHRRFNTPKFFPYAFLFFFPALMGFQNIYRQYLCMCVLLYSLSLSYTGSKKSYFFWLLSSLVHNVGFIFLPLLFVFSKSNNVRKLFYVSGAFVLILLPLAAGSKSHDSTGLNLGVAYMACTVAVLLVVLFTHQFSKVKNNNHVYIMYQLYLTLILLVNLFILGSSQAERVGMLSLSLSVWVLGIFLRDKYKQSTMLNVILLFLLSLPTFLFDSALNMLLTSELSIK